MAISSDDFGAGWRWQAVAWVLLPLLLIGLSAGPYFRDRGHIARAEAALADGDCPQAVAALVAVQDGWRLVDAYGFGQQASTRLDAIEVPCTTHVSAQAMLDRGDTGAALATYTGYLSTHPTDRSPLADTMRSQVRELWNGTATADLVENGAVCAALPDLRRTDLLPDPAAALPALYADCARYEAAASDYPAMLGYYATYTEAYPAHPDAATLQADLMAALWQDAPPTAQISEATCDIAPDLDAAGLFPDRETALPSFYTACGDFYLEAERTDAAIAIFTAFTEQFPAHPQAEAVTEQLAGLIVAEADSANADEITLPEAVRRPGAVNAVVTIQNASPEPLRIVLTGPQTYIQTLPACTTCDAFTTAPPTCPQDGGYGEYEMVAGTYSVVVSSLGDFMVPFRGTWHLETGYEYPNCFFIVQR